MEKLLLMRAIGEVVGGFLLIMGTLVGIARAAIYFGPVVFLVIFLLIGFGIMLGSLVKVRYDYLKKEKVYPLYPRANKWSNK